MAAKPIEPRGIAPPLVQRGYHIVYHDGEPNHCPGCGHAQWYVGRLSAECAFCGTAVPRENAALGGPVHQQEPAAAAARSRLNRPGAGAIPGRRALPNRPGALRSSAPAR